MTNRPSNSRDGIVRKFLKFHGGRVPMRCEAFAAMFVALTAIAVPVMAQDFPARKPITIVVPFAPGGSTDTAARMVAERMTVFLKQTVLVDNKPGASGTIGANYVARSTPDGYTVGALGGSTTVIPHLMGPVPPYKFDDIVLVGQLCLVEAVIVARKDLPASNSRELIALAKAQPGKLQYGESGTAMQLAFELFKSTSGTDILRVPYKGDAPALTDVLGGHIDLAMVSLAGAAAHIRAGTVKVIGVTSAERSKAFPAAPTIAEAGLPGYEASVTTMLAVPRGTPQAVIQRLNEALNESLKDPVVIDRFTSLGLGAQRLSPADALAALKADLAKADKVIKDAKIPTER
jgi:tripartite-type tricarboxylate transporter receptor subunit TctC